MRKTVITVLMSLAIFWEYLIRSLARRSRLSVVVKGKKTI